MKNNKIYKKINRIKEISNFQTNKWVIRQSSISRPHRVIA